ncbi:MAG: hypothetical protein GX558_02370 [Clostridiales bacterium]|nr:hypothetical protein [Clostridiales bacterium]
MFGYLTVKSDALPPDERARYRAFYCGLCRQLGGRYGGVGRSRLSGDMAFVALLLSSACQLDESAGRMRCAANPLIRRRYIETQATAYAADMNALLAYYQCLDDWRDDRNLAAAARARALEKFVRAIERAHPTQAAVIAGRLADLRAMEVDNELNPDRPANCFGELMGAVFAWRDDGLAQGLFRLGAALGRFIYLMDAVNDLKADIRRQRYNPLVALMQADYTPMLTMMMAECAEAFDALDVRRDRHILENHLYAGVWQKYRARERKGEG